MTEEWENKKESFEVTDVRELTENILPLLLKKAGKVTVGDEWHVSSA